MRDHKMTKLEELRAAWDPRCPITTGERGDPMMDGYKSYKEWWMKYEAPYKTDNLGCTDEEAFAQHIKDMDLYEIMETLADWVEASKAKEREQIEYYDRVRAAASAMLLVFMIGFLFMMLN